MKPMPPQTPEAFKAWHLRRRCPYCGHSCTRGLITCAAHRHLPRLDPHYNGGTQ